MTAETIAEIPVHQSIAHALIDHGVDTVFGLMGDANLFIVDHYVRELGGRFVPAAHEASCVLMAMGYAHVSGRLGVATVTHGPAVTNCITPLVEAVRGHSPMVLLAGDTPAGYPRHTQNIDQRELIKTTGAGFEQMRAPATAAEDVARAFYRAEVERRPIVLNMPVDFMWETTGHTARKLDVYTGARGAAESDVFNDAVGMIASARRPLILAGGGAAGAREQLIGLADRLEAPLATTLKGKDLFRDHPYNIGFFGTLSSPAAYEVMAVADCIVCFGASLTDYTTDHGKLMKDKRVIQIDIEPGAIGGGLHPDAAIVADAGEAADKIRYWLDQAEAAPSGFTPELDPTRLTHYPVTASKTKDGRIDYVHALERLEAALPEDRILVTDVGRFMLEAWCRISVTGPQSFVPTTNFTSIGLGLQTAIGAGVAAPDRTVVLFSGDGGFMMGALTEFHNLVNLGMDCIVIIANDSSYGAEHIQFMRRQMDPGLSVLNWPNFTDLARAFGASSFKVDSEAELETALEGLRSRQGPVLIELCLDPGDMPPPRV
ncbi:MAG: thiamine pyrophosphate-binding protein [Pseudomonadota bacterium]